MGDTVYVYVGDGLYATLSLDTPLSDEYLVETDAGELRLSVPGEGVAVTHADCPDGVCVRTGRIAKQGESIVCVPLGVCITVGTPEYDGVTG